MHAINMKHWSKFNLEISFFFLFLPPSHCIQIIAFKWNTDYWIMYPSIIPRFRFKGNTEKKKTSICFLGVWSINLKLTSALGLHTSENMSMTDFKFHNRNGRDLVVLFYSTVTPNRFNWYLKKWCQILKRKKSLFVIDNIYCHTQMTDLIIIYVCQAMLVVEHPCSKRFSAFCPKGNLFSLNSLFHHLLVVRGKKKP